MAKKREAFWEKQASKKMIFFCFLLIIATFICFGGTYLQVKITKQEKPDEIWTDSTTSYDEKVRRQEELNRSVMDSREGIVKE